MSSLTAELAQQALIPQEKLAKAAEGRVRLQIGLPKEIASQENRIALTPEAVQLVVRNGNEVILEKGAGEGAKFSDSMYAEAGAMIAPSAKEVLESGIILKINPLTAAEFEFIKPDTTIISTLNSAQIPKEYFDKMLKKRANGIAFEYLQDQSGGFPVVRAMSEIAGGSVMLIAAELLSSVNHGRGMLLGGITGVPPTKVVILGAGTVAEYAVRVALGLGADIKIFDKEIYRLQRLRYAVGQAVSTSIIDSNNLEEAISRADVVIGAMRAENGRSPCVVTETMVAKMKANAVIIDISIDQGGCFETSKATTLKKPTYIEHGVIHYCVPNIASRVGHTASMALSNIFTPFLLKTSSIGGIEELIFSNQWSLKGVYTHKGSITNRFIAKKFGFRFKDLSLLTASARF